MDVVICSSRTAQRNQNELKHFDFGHCRSLSLIYCCTMLSCILCRHRWSVTGRQLVQHLKCIFQFQPLCIVNFPKVFSSLLLLHCWWWSWCMCKQMTQLFHTLLYCLKKKKIASRICRTMFVHCVGDSDSRRTTKVFQLK